MSIRQTDATNVQAAQLRSDLESLRRAQVNETVTEASVESGLSFDDLNETEKSAATMGVSPDAWRPIGEHI
tara:strand:- start:820 stop:1032 length:213 start_codon:yes stop_codon:yes gene_type:complete